jgi:hypothetical protein
MLSHAEFPVLVRERWGTSSDNHSRLTRSEENSILSLT